MIKVLFAATALALVAVQAHAADPNIGDIQITKLIVMPSQDGHNDWSDAINNATSSVDMTMFHITDKAFVNQVIAKAKSSSVKIRIITDGKAISAKPTDPLRMMVDAGIDVRLGSPKFSITHEKGMVVDGRLAFVTSINLTNTAQNSRDYGVETTDSGIISEMESVFAADWDNSANSTGNTPALSNPNLLWSPVNSKSKLVNFIDNAQSSLIATVESLTDKDLLAAYGRAEARGVKVQMIVPKCDEGQALLNYPAIATLKQSNVEVKVMPSPASFDQPYMHAKMMVADGQEVYIGSVNYSYNSTERARELGVLFTDAPSAATLAQDFATDWNRSEDPVDNPDKSICSRSFSEDSTPEAQPKSQAWPVLPKVF